MTLKAFFELIRKPEIAVSKTQRFSMQLSGTRDNETQSQLKRDRQKSI